MSGYTPVFKSVFTGSLTGKWPDTGLWVSLLALADKNGELDYTPQYISMVTGLELAEVDACLKRFMEPDPMSRSPTDDGRRLVLTHESRPWGWRIVNFASYRERARLAAKNAREVEQGANKERMEYRRRPPVTAGDRRLPPVTDPSNANTNTNKKKAEGADAPVVAGLDSKAWEAWVAYRAAIKKPLNPATHQVAMKQMAALGAAQMAAVEHSMANNYRGLFAPDEKHAPLAPSGLPKVFGETV